jgi:predicted SnoaL-like aldol condensation-catalyzing enzyme
MRKKETKRNGMLKPKNAAFGILAGVAVLLCSVYAAAPGNFLPDYTFRGSALTGWHSLGQAQWKAANSEIIADPGSAGGWLVLDKPYQDLQFYSEFRCGAPCSAGILIRGAKTPDGGLKGLYVSLKGGDFASYILTLDAQGREVQREKLKGMPAPTMPAGYKAPPPPPQPAGAPAKPVPARSGPEPAQVAGDWNKVEITLTGSYFRPTIGGISIPTGGLDEVPGYGLVALYAGGPGEVRFRSISSKDLLSVTEPKEQSSSRFSVQRLIDFYYGWSAVSADINHDGILDVVYGPFYFLGPNFTERKWYREDRIYNPSNEFAPDMINFAYDFTGDGWPDILSSELDFSAGGGRPLDLYVNPKGESRRWDKFARVVPDIFSESVLMRDVDGDGKPEVLYSATTGLAYAKPGDDPTKTWKVHPISSDKGYLEGVGLGDINGDKRMDVVCPGGWYQQGATPDDWTFHPSNFGSAGVEMGVYDVNGDGLNDIVTVLDPHRFGLAWFEQKRDASGTIAFAEHVISTDYSVKNALDVTFSQPHAVAFADFDGNGIKDIVVGKSLWHHLETYMDPDPYGPAVLYLYRGIHNPSAAGGVEFFPELIHNRSGVGSALELADLNKDGALDILTASGKGAFVALGNPGPWGNTGCTAGSPRIDLETFKAFANEVIVQKQPRRAFERLAVEDMVQHASAFGRNRETTIVQWESMTKQPTTHWDIDSLILDGDVGVVSFSGTMNPGTPGVHVTNYYRFQCGKIVENWDKFEIAK